MSHHKNENAFTLIEMLIVLMVITVLILLFVPNLTNQSKAVHDKGCDALVQTVQAQVHAYQLDTGSLPTSLNALKDAGYITENQLTCENEKALSLDSSGVVNVNHEGD